MKRISFDLARGASLEAVAHSGFNSYMPNFAPGRQAINSVTFWRSKDAGMKIASTMHDIGERLEVGVLRIEVVDWRPEYMQVTRPLPSEFCGSIEVEKLVGCHGSIEFESGLLLRSAKGNVIALVAAAHPYMIALSGLLEQKFWVPEYDLDFYRNEKLRLSN